MKTSEILIKARDLIADPARCCIGELARNAYGEEVAPSDPDACSWCSMGAVQRVHPDDLAGRSDAYRYLRSAMPNGWWAEIGDFHDTHTHAEVMTMFDTAIAMAQARGD